MARNSSTESNGEILLPDGEDKEEKKSSYRAAIHTGPERTLPPPFVDAVLALEKSLKMPIWLLIQNDESCPYGLLNREVSEAFFNARHELKKSGPIALVIDSPGGFARSAYQIAKILRNHAKGFVVVVPKFAKSAATLLALGANKIILAQDAELGPLDAQIFDADREDTCSALDEVQALERLHAAAMEMVDQTVLLMHIRSGKKLENLLPLATNFAAQMMRPLLEKIDTT